MQQTELVYFITDCDFSRVKTKTSVHIGEKCTRSLISVNKNCLNKSEEHIRKNHNVTKIITKCQDDTKNVMSRW